MVWVVSGGVEGRNAPVDDLHRTRLAGLSVCIDFEDVRARGDDRSVTPREILPVVWTEIDFPNGQNAALKGQRGRAAVRLLRLRADENLVHDRLATVDGDRAGAGRACRIVPHHGAAQIPVDFEESAVERERGGLGPVVVADAEGARAAARRRTPHRAAVYVHGGGVVPVNANEVADAGVVAANDNASPLGDIGRSLIDNESLTARCAVDLRLGAPDHSIVRSILPDQLRRPRAYGAERDGDRENPTRGLHKRNILHRFHRLFLVC